MQLCLAMAPCCTSAGISRQASKAISPLATMCARQLTKQKQYIIKAVKYADV